MKILIKCEYCGKEVEVAIELPLMNIHLPHPWGGYSRDEGSCEVTYFECNSCNQD